MTRLSVSRALRSFGTAVGRTWRGLWFVALGVAIGAWGIHLEQGNEAIDARPSPPGEVVIFSNREETSVEVNMRTDPVERSLLVIDVVVGGEVEAVRGLRVLVFVAGLVPMDMYALNPEMAAKLGESAAPATWPSAHLDRVLESDDAITYYELNGDEAALQGFGGPLTDGVAVEGAFDVTDKGLPNVEFDGPLTENPLGGFGTTSSGDIGVSFQMAVRTQTDYWTASRGRFVGALPFVGGARRDGQIESFEPDGFDVERNGQTSTWYAPTVSAFTASVVPPSDGYTVLESSVSSATLVEGELMYSGTPLQRFTWLMSDPLEQDQAEESIFFAGIAIGLAVSFIVFGLEMIIERWSTDRSAVRRGRQSEGPSG